MFPNPEDCSSPGLYHGGTVTFTDSDVERVRRAHRNDLENIGLFLVVAHFYLMTNPPVAVATNLMRGFACLRFCHTLIYLNRVSLEPYTVHVDIQGGPSPGEPGLG